MQVELVIKIKQIPNREMNQSNWGKSKHFVELHDCLTNGSGDTAPFHCDLCVSRSEYERFDGVQHNISILKLFCYNLILGQIQIFEEVEF